MDFALSDEQRMIAETVDGFFREHATSQRTRAAMACEGIDRALWRSFCSELGLAGVAIPEECGGAGLGLIELALVAEAAGRMVAALPLLGHAMVARALVASGDEDLCETWLAQMVSGEAIAAVGEAEAVSEGKGLSLVADYVPHGAAADLFLVHGDGHLWLVEAGSPGVSVTAHTTLDQTRPYATLALANAPARELPRAEKAWAAALQAGLVCLAAEALGGAQEALDRTVAFSKERVQFGRQIGSFQAYKHRLADMLVEIEQARSAVYWAACAVDEDSPEMNLALPAAKSFCADTYYMAAANMIQLHGGIGFTWEHDAHLFFKRARSIQTLLGNGNAHRETVAAMILGEAV